MTTWALGDTMLAGLRRRTITRLSIALLGLQVLDLFTTAISMHYGGAEANPLVLALGWPLAIAGKFLTTGLLIGFCQLSLRRNGYRLARTSLFITCGYMAAVVAWNFGIILALNA